MKYRYQCVVFDWIDLVVGGSGFEKFEGVGKGFWEKGCFENASTDSKNLILVEN